MASDVQKFYIHTPQDCIDLTSKVSQLPELHLGYEVTVQRIEEKRRLKQNKLAFKWYKDRAYPGGGAQLLQAEVRGACLGR